MAGRTQGRFYRIKRAQREKDFANLSEQLERMADPLEQAKSFIQSRGIIITAEHWTDDNDKPVSGWRIGTRERQSNRDLLDLAQRKGWKPKPRDEKEVKAL